MKTPITLFFSFILILLLGGSKMCVAQSVVTGHMSAEVIESVSASSQVVTSFTLDPTAGNNSQSSGQSEFSTSTIPLGAITINNGNQGTVNVVLKPATFSNSHGNGFTLDTTLVNKSFTASAQSDNSQTIQLNGTANLGASQASGIYQGSYTVVFAYN